MAETQEQVNEIVAIREEFQKEYEQKFEIWKAKEFAEFKEKQDKELQEQVGKMMTKWLEEQKPPTLDDIKKLLEQEYIEVPIKIPLVNDDGTSRVEVFTVRELPQSVERKFYRQFKDRVKEKAPQLASFVQQNMDLPFEQQVSGFLDTFEGAFDLMADATVIILNPFNKKPEITAQWVADNIGSNRMYSIVLAQVEVNRLRDFFSRLFQSGQRAGTMFTPLGIQQLRQLAR